MVRLEGEPEALTLLNKDRIQFDNPRLIDAIKLSCPIVVQNTPIAQSLLHWDPEFLEKNFGEHRCNVFSAKTNLFKYNDPAKNVGFEAILPSTRSLMTMSEFVSKMKEHHEDGPARTFHYLQEVFNHLNL